MLGILLLAHGGPDHLDDLPAFLERVRGGRPYSEELLDEVRKKYRVIGGVSPLPEITRRTASKLEQACGLPTYVGMLHWRPFLEDTIPQMALDGVTRALVICLVPHFSECSVGRYRKRTASAAAGSGLAFDFVDSWHTAPPYVDALADSVAASGEKLGCGPGVQAHVVFTAHSLPKAALGADDPYPVQLQETAELVAGRLGLPREGWTIAYQSASGPAEAWLGPSIDQAISDLAERGEKRAVICPFGFVADQVEILYDLDVVARQKAGDLGCTVARTPLLNDSPALIDTLASLVERWRQ